MADEAFRTYRNRVLWGPFQPVSLRDWKRARREIGGELPADYRRFIEVANGGSLEYSIDLPPGPDGEPITFDELHTITPNQAGEFSWGTVIGEKRQLVQTYYGGAVPADAVPIAGDGGGSTLFIRLHDEHHGEVHAFVHGLPEWAGGTQQDSHGFVAPSFDAFLDLLYIHEELAEMQWQDSAGDPEWRTVVERWLDSGFPEWRARPWASTP